MTLLEHAQDALRRGLKVFPLNPREKTPCGELVPHGVLQATADAGQVFRWWSLKPGCNIGCCGGVIVDVDSGLQTFEDALNWATACGLPPTLMIKTGRTTAYGVQFHYRDDKQETVPGLYHINGSSGEIRSQNLYGIFAGSVHPSGEVYTIVQDLPRAIVPRNLFMQNRIGNEMRSVRGINNDTEYPCVDLWHAREIYQGLLYKAGKAKEGARNHTAHALTYFAARAWLAEVFQEQEVCGHVVAPGMTEAELKWQIYRTVRSRYTKNERNVKKMLADSWRYGIEAGPVLLEVYPSDFRTAQKLSDDEKFQRAMDGDVRDFTNAVAAREYLEQKLAEAGADNEAVRRILNFSRIWSAIAHEVELELKLQLAGDQ